MAGTAQEFLKSQLGLTLDELIDKNKIKVINGIAGCGKSSIINQNLPNGYLRLTSTNRLKMDAQGRYGDDCSHATIAGGMFKNQNMKFYIGPREIKEETVVIDEILQTNAKVIQLARSMAGRKNVIILTDDRQLLGRNASVIKEFDKLKTDVDVIYRECKRTLRAKNKQTKDIYDFLYDSVNRGYNAFQVVQLELPFMDYRELDFNENDVYICHTNEIEELLYLDFDLKNRYDIPLIKKGGIASKENIDYSRYPILSQNQAEKVKSQRYLQIAQVGSAHRYQGSEVSPDQNLYYLISRRSKISNREIYTVASRCKDIRSLKLVYVEDKLIEVIKKFNGLPVREYAIYRLSGKECITGGKTIAKKADESEGRNILVKYQDIVRLYSQIDKSDTSVSYDEHTFFFDDRFVIQGEGDEEAEARNIAPIDNSLSIHSLLKKDPALTVSYMPAVYKYIDQLGLNSIKTIIPDSPSQKEKYSFELDLKSAYPHILSYSKVPVAGRISEIRSDKNVNFFLAHTPYGDRIASEHALSFLDEQGIEYEFLFGVPAEYGCTIGKTLLDYDKKDKYQKNKNIFWGVLAKPFLEPAEYESGVNTCYRTRTNHIYELLYVSIRCELIRICQGLISELKKIGCKCTQIVDSVRFTLKDGCIEKAKSWMQEHAKDYNYRIRDLNKSNWYQTDDPYTFMQDEDSVTWHKMTDEEIVYKTY